MDKKRHLTYEEIFFLAVRLERKKELLYRTLAMRVPEPLHKKTFDMLAGEEAKHAETFKILYDASAKREHGPEKDEFPPRSGISALFYETSLVQSGIDDMLASHTGAPALIDHAAACEDSTIHFYSSLKDKLPETYRHALLGIVSDEKRHVEKLTYLKREVH